MLKYTEYKYHLAALFTVTVWGATFVSTKVLIANSLTPAEIFLLRFAMAYVCILPFARGRMWAAGLRDELLLAAAGLSGGSLYFLTENVALEYAPGLERFADRLHGTRMDRRAAEPTVRQRADVAAADRRLGAGIRGHGARGAERALRAPSRREATCWRSRRRCYGWFTRWRSNASEAATPPSSSPGKSFFYGLVTILPVFAFRPFDVSWEVLSRPVVWGNLLFLGVVASMLCYVLWNAAMHRLGAVRTTNYIYFNPLVTIVAAALCIGERITLAALAGAALILYGMWRAEKG